ncbi:MAG: precorrin-3B C(17)-methyltransferase, partial [Nitrospinaceae bacterium]|nr:precorrin-3B C(17)-methyltransferase [Nitrospinaceae bacterium]
MENLAGGPAVFILSGSALETAEKVRDAISGAQIHGLARRVPEADVTFEDAAQHLRDMYQGGQEIIGICAAAILIRALGPILSDKSGEPAVVALSEDGKHVIPLLGGHRGANRRAEELASLLGGKAALTTAGDVNWGVALDDPPEGYTLDRPEEAKAFSARLLAGEQVRLEGKSAWLAGACLPLADDAALSIRVGVQKVNNEPDALNYFSKSVVIGVGCERGAPPDDVLALVHRSLAAINIDTRAVGLIVSIDLKADEPALHYLGKALDAPVRFFSSEVLEKEAHRIPNPSEVVFKETGCHGVAEGAVLAALGPAQSLALEKQIMGRATCCIGVRERPWLEPLPGTARGELFVIGLGPGGSGWRTAEAETLIRHSTDLVGYRLYLDLAGPLTSGKHLHPYELGEEETRVRAALDLAGEGRRVGLLCSGDPGIYAMASLVYEMLDRENNPAWQRVHVQVSPGVSALQAAAARVGAPLGHDFCTISLSDLLTPWEIIEKRVMAAAAGDFNIAFYNPVSARRKTQLDRARQILLGHRSPETPVVVA